MYAFLTGSIALCFSMIPFFYGKNISKLLMGTCVSLLAIIFCLLDLSLLAILVSILSILYMSKKNSLENYKKLLEKARC